jgi:hypothetical protein
MPVFSHRVVPLAVTAVTYLRDFCRIRYPRSCPSLRLVTRRPQELILTRPFAIRNKNRQGKTDGSDSDHMLV